MKRTNVREVQLQRSAQSLRQERHALPQAFSIAHSDLLVTEVDVFDAQTQTLLYGAGLRLMELGDGSDSLVYREMSEKFGDFLLPHFIRLAFPMKENVTADPIYVRFFGANGVMFDAQMPADAIKKLGRRCGCSGGGRHAGIVSKLLRHGNPSTSANSR
jgi:hypothetical protein